MRMGRAGGAVAALGMLAVLAWVGTAALHEWEMRRPPLTLTVLSETADVETVAQQQAAAQGTDLSYAHMGSL